MMSEEERTSKRRTDSEFCLPGRAVQNPGARIQDREDNISNLSGV
jgi:hypothetical protein